MTWRLELSHETGYRYPRAVAASYNEIRLTPISTAGQLTIDARIQVEPAAKMTRYWDYWGTFVQAFDVHTPHDELVVRSTALVETPETHGPRDAPDATWDTLVRPDVLDAFYEFLTPTRATQPDAGLHEVARQLRAGSATPAVAVDDAAAWVHDQLVYSRGTTSVSTPALDAWHAGRGVCQDFVHLTLALLRAMGIPARYVSGYFHPVADAPIGETIEGESHAWGEAWLGEWFAFDPTNLVLVGERHVVVARGREYRDVTPIKGIYSGAPSSVSSVRVELTRTM